MVIIIILAVLVLAGLVALVFSRSFRTFVSDELTGLGLLIQAYWPSFVAWLRNVWRTLSGIIGVYALVLASVALVTFFLTIGALIIGSPGLTGFVFVLSICLILLAWMPVGIIRKLFGRGFVPQSLKVFIALIAFVGFLGLVSPGLFSFKVIIGAALVVFIMLGVSAKINILDKVIYPIVIVMIAVLAWEYFFPESYRSSIRYAQSWGKRIEADTDRGSLSNEAQAATTYGIILKDVAVLYNLTPVSAEEKEVSLKAGQEVKIVNHRAEVTIYDGQGFIQIQLPKENGSFFKGDKLWIEAEFVEVVSPNKIIPQRITQNKPQPTAPTPTPAPSTPSTVLGKGAHRFYMKAGEVSDFQILSTRFCVKTDQGDMATLVYPNRVPINLWQTAVLPNDNIFSVKSLVDQTVIITVS
jgi:hypothetical protein